MDGNGQGGFVGMFPGEEYKEFRNKFMVAAIVCLSIGIFFMCLLHLYAKHVHRQRERNRAAVRALALRVALVRSERPELLPKVGLDPSAIAALPLFMYRVRENEDGEKGQEQVMECSVCLTAFADGDSARVLPNCKHYFHAECIDKWLGSNTTCPVCRAGAMPRLLPEPREPPAGSGPFEMVTIRTVKPGRSASSSCLEGTSDTPSSTGATTGKAATGCSSAGFGSIRRILSWERPSPRTQSNSHEDGTEHDIESQ